MPLSMWSHPLQHEQASSPPSLYSTHATLPHTDKALTPLHTTLTAPSDGRARPRAVFAICPTHEANTPAEMKYGTDTSGVYIAKGMDRMTQEFKPKFQTPPPHFINYLVLRDCQYTKSSCSYQVHDCST